VPALGTQTLRSARSGPPQQTRLLSRRNYRRVFGQKGSTAVAGMSPSEHAEEEPRLRPRFVPVAAAGSKRPFSPAKLLVWSVAAPVAGLLVGWAGQQIQAGITLGEAQLRFAPWLLFPLLLGVVLGGVLFGLMRVVQLGHRPTVLAGMVPAVILAVLVQHYAAYWECRAVRQRNRQQHPGLMALQHAMPDGLDQRLAPPPKSLLAYLREEAAHGRPLTATWTARGVWAWASWALDALLTIGAAVAMVGAAIGQPYCPECGSWYRTVRRGRLKGPAAAGLLGRLFDQATPAQRVSYRLQECLARCGPSRLTIAVSRPDGTSDSGEWYLDARGRELLIGALKEARCVHRKRGDSHPAAGESSNLPRSSQPTDHKSN